MAPLHSRWSLSAMIYHHKPFLRDFYVRLPVCLYHLFYLLAPLHKGWMLMMTMVPILITFVPPFILLPSNDWMTNHHSFCYLYLLVGRSIREGHIWFIKRTKISNPCDLLWTLKNVFFMTHGSPMESSFPHTLLAPLCFRSSILTYRQKRDWIGWTECLFPLNGFYPCQCLFNHRPVTRGKKMGAFNV
jgi:hypothetical protein